MRRDMDVLKERHDAIKRSVRQTYRFLADTQGPWAEEEYDLAHKAAREAEAALGEVSRMLHEHAQEAGYTMPTETRKL